jgi:hypothetical protein
VNLLIFMEWHLFLTSITHPSNVARMTQSSKYEMRWELVSSLPLLAPCLFFVCIPHGFQNRLAPNILYGIDAGKYRYALHGPKKYVNNTLSIDHTPIKLRCIKLPRRDDRALAMYRIKLDSSDLEPS